VKLKFLKTKYDLQVDAPPSESSDSESAVALQPNMSLAKMVKCNLCLPITCCQLGEQLTCRFFVLTEAETGLDDQQLPSGNSAIAARQQGGLRFK